MAGAKPVAVVVVFPGSNGDHDLFETFERAGFRTRMLASDDILPPDADVVGLPGGFSYGDYWRAGMLSSQAKAVQCLPDHVSRGGLVIGVCNGFQILVEAGLLPGALTYNRPPGFLHRWVTLKAIAARPSPWFSTTPPGTTLRVPLAHGEGNYFHPAGPAGLTGVVPLVYEANPNGSLQNAAALLDPTGHILGLMPHPERASEPDLGSADGLRLFQAAVAYAESGAVSHGVGGSAASHPVRTSMQEASLSTSQSATDAALPGTCELAVSLGLMEREYHHIVKALDRVPNRTELTAFAGMWSEHCSYKSTLKYLAGLPKEGPRVLAGPGSHAGVVDVGDGWAVAFKVESHNHPSAVEPYQGAATGVGGILRDIVAQGARPCAVMDSLCFGDPHSRRTRHLRDGIVAGIGGYGNPYGVPNVGGRTEYDPRYEGNPLVNALAAGLLRPDAMRTGCAQGVGNAVLYVGATTGRDGILGAAFASEELREDTAASRSHVQVGDPFTGKKLMEACLSFTPQMGLVACQDMGATGVTCATTEMAAAGGVGMDIDLDAIPLREADMTAHEILVSESQERFLFVVEAGKEQTALAHFRKSSVHAAICGRVTEGDRVRATFQGEQVLDLPARLIADETPPCDWPVAPCLPDPVPYPDFEPGDFDKHLLKLLGEPGIADQEPLYQRYDQTVGNRTVRGPGAADAAVLKLPDSRRGFALCITGRGSVCAVDPYLGAQAALGEAMRNLACVGAEMVAITDGLNMGSPRDPVENRRLVATIEGLGDGLRALAIPVTGGNVSLYNESPQAAIPPTPMVGALGIAEDVQVTPRAWHADGEVIFLLGKLCETPCVSTYGRLRTGHLEGGRPVVDLAAEQRLARFLIEQVSAARVRSAKGTGAGGLGVALAKMCIRGRCGASLTLPETRSRYDWALFGEHAAGAWVSVATEAAEPFEQAARSSGLVIHRAGLAGGERLCISGLLDLPVASLSQAFAAKGDSA